ncbi:hypothetical protein EG68_03249 [Paragonimus skrjabini miyazakii]|uniref:Cadherin domain-containing protein n=1 Tax=Paragonimus skrjabini miyazakii TaxID=59628 RepID=A0A8S9Z2C1_9TREM|nr:hypothetical protein EG68_03249 [Paragonimus skrjabini miyazakii]
MTMLHILFSFECLLVAILSQTQPVIEILEEAPPGTVLIDNLQTRFQFGPNYPPTLQYAAIGNPSSPGIASLEIRPHRFGGNLQLVIRDGSRGPDREELCDTRQIPQSQHPPPCDIALVILHGDRQNPSYAKLTLRILDINDNAPTFAKGDLLEVRIPEDLPDSRESSSSVYATYAKYDRPTHTISLPTAFDLDMAENDIKYYRLTTISGHEVDETQFTLVNNGSGIAMDSSRLSSTDLRGTQTPALQITGQLDREKQSDLWFHLLALDGGIPQRTGTLSIHLIVTDLNDNRPKFRKPIYHQPTFVLNAEPYGSPATSSDVLRIVETLPVGSELLTLIADDVDEGVNAQVTYRLREPLASESDAAMAYQSFALTRRNHSVSLRIARPLDADSPHGKMWVDSMNKQLFGNIVHLTVEAVDAGSPALTGTATIPILIENVNDNQPEIAVQFTNPIQISTSSFNHSNTGSTQAGTLQENLTGPNTVAHLTVTDGDLLAPSSSTRLSSHSQPRDNVRCEANDTRFSLDKLPSMSSQIAPDSGSMAHTSLSLYFYRVSALKMVDREEAEWIHVQITCIDQVGAEYPQYGFPATNTYLSTVQLTGSVIMTIKVLDVNDNAPKFTKEIYRYSVTETPSNPSLFGNKFIPDTARVLVGQVHAVDADDGANGLVHYRLLTNPRDAFQVDTIKGTIWRVGPLDREKDAHFELKIEAQDQSIPALSSTCLVEVNVLDVNDHVPYWVPSGLEEEMGKYRFGRSEDGVFYFSVSEDTEVGQTIGLLRAFDVDGITENDWTQIPIDIQASNTLGNHLALKSDSGLIYQLEAVEDASAFAINRRTGELRLNRKLDRETRAHYELRAFAIDNPPASLSTPLTHVGSVVSSNRPWEAIPSIRYTATATVIVTVLDVNDNYPQFESPLIGQEFHIEPGSSLATPGTTLFTAKAYDADNGENATVRYALEGGGYGLVEIDSTTGMCYTREPIQKSTLMNLFANTHIALTEHMQTSSRESVEGGKIQGDVSNIAPEGRSFSISLVVIAYDLGTPKQLNNSRTVRLVWNAGNMKDTQSSYPHSALLGGAYGQSLLFNGKWNRTERIVIPLVIGAFLQGKFQLNDRLREPSRHQQFGSPPPELNRSKTRRKLDRWRWCNQPGESQLEPIGTVSDKLDRRVTKVMGNNQSNMIGSPIYDYQNRPMSREQFTGRCATALENPLPTTMQSYLPDCIPVTEANFQDTFEHSEIGHMLINSQSSKVMKSEWKNRTRYVGSTLSRAFSEESLGIAKQTDLGYTALRAYPTMVPESIRFAPILDGRDTESYYRVRKQTRPFSPAVHHKPNEDNRTIPVCRPISTARPEPVRLNSSAFYNPFNMVANTTAMTYPTLTYDPGSDLEPYEQYELEADTGDQDGTKPRAHAGGSGWKVKLADAYAENTFV